MIPPHLLVYTSFGRIQELMETLPVQLEQRNWHRKDNNVPIIGHIPIPSSGLSIYLFTDLNNSEFGNVALFCR